MIGVISSPEQFLAVSEFFQIFKTPWEIYNPDKSYQVILVSGGCKPCFGTKLTIIFGPSNDGFDSELGLSAAVNTGIKLVQTGDTSLPVYQALADFRNIEGYPVIVHYGTLKVGFSLQRSGSQILRVGYDLFQEVQFLLSEGQPPDFAGFPTLDLHIELLRSWILAAEVRIFEVRPVPSTFDFMVCLTHDIDFVGIRNHKFDHSMLGFVFRATIGSLFNVLNGRLTWKKVLKNWGAVASVPLVWLGLMQDFWEPFDWYLKIEEGLPATYFLIPFKGRAGEKVPGKYSSRRAAAYDLSQLEGSTSKLLSSGCELAVHGIDAWHSIEEGAKELNKLRSITGIQSTGVRIHWLLRDKRTFSVLEDSGYSYDSTVGYNETIGYRSGTSCVYRPLGVTKLLELPIVIQDGALFYPQRLNFTESQATDECDRLIQLAKKNGGVLTLIWHDRSHASERLWGDFYEKLLIKLRRLNAIFLSASSIVEWFGARREIKFEQKNLDGKTHTFIVPGPVAVSPGFCIRFYQPISSGEVNISDLLWRGTLPVDAFSVFTSKTSIETDGRARTQSSYQADQ